jgi:hypothetical protein
LTLIFAVTLFVFPSITSTWDCVVAAPPHSPLAGSHILFGHLEKYSLEAGRSAIEVAVVSVSGLMGAGLSSRLFEAATRAIGKTI